MEHQSTFQRASQWRLRTRNLELPRRPLLMGILNVTPDSFSDGGRFLDVDAAVAQAHRLVVEGADLLDVGGESTRPGAAAVSESEEMSRVLPVVRRLVDELAIPISVDTRKARVARAAVEAGAEIINDVSGGEHDPAMIDAVAASGAGVCVMHMQGSPETMQMKPTYGDVVAEVVEYLRGRRDALIAAGIAQERICLDPGIGFGKTFEHNLELLKNCRVLFSLGCPVLVGHSRKSFLGKLLGDSDADRTQAGVGVALGLAQQSVPLLRVHDVRAVREALLAFEAGGGLAFPSGMEYN
jgi:dihydropteroate synthase